MEERLSLNPVPPAGARTLISFGIRKEDGEVIDPFEAKPQGSLIYTSSGRFSAQVVRPDRYRRASGNPMKAAEGILFSHRAPARFACYGPMN